MTDQTSFIPTPPTYWQPPPRGWGQPAGVWTSRPVPPVQEPARTPSRRPPTRVLLTLLALMTVAAGVFGVLYVTGSSSAAGSLAAAQAATENQRDARQQAEAARDEAKDRAATAEDERDAAKTTAQGLQACQEASKDLLTAVTGPESQAATDAATDALTRMDAACR